jgi:hypothetical protein
MTAMLARTTPRCVLIGAAILLSIAPLSMSQSQGRGQRGQRGAPAQEAPVQGGAGTAIPPEPGRVPPPAQEVPARGAAGTAIPPEPGRVPPPEPVTAGTIYPAAIPPDAADQGFWALYDRDKQVSISGKVTKVNWTEPNAYIFLQNSSGEWAVEASYIQFRQSSVTPAVRVNQTISVSGYLAKEEPSVKLGLSSPFTVSYQKAKRLLRASEITTEYGQRLRMGRPLTEAEEKSDLLRCPGC